MMSSLPIFPLMHPACGVISKKSLHSCVRKTQSFLLCVSFATHVEHVTLTLDVGDCTK